MITLTFQVQTEIGLVTGHRKKLLAAMAEDQRKEVLEISRKLEERVRNEFDRKECEVNWFLFIGSFNAARSKSRATVATNSNWFAALN